MTVLLGDESRGYPDATPAIPCATGGPAADWIDRFMERILQREYEAAREVLRSAVAQGAGKSVAEQYGKVLEEFLQRKDEVDNPRSLDLACFGVCALREMDNQTGRGLIVPGYVNWGDELWRQRPVTYMQSPPSRKCVQACCACCIPVGTLASQLETMGLPVPAGAEEIEVPGAGQIFRCPGGCGEVFCGQACYDWARENSSHAVLCRSCLSTDAAAALESLAHFALETDQEHLLLLAHHIAMALLRRRAGDDLSEVRQKYVTQFCRAPWESLADADDPGGDTPSNRRDSLAKARNYLLQIYADEPLAEPFLDMDTLSSMLGTYELVNMCISIPHPLNSQGSRIADLLGGSALAKLHEQQKGVDSESDDEDEESSQDPGDAETRAMKSLVEGAADGRLKAVLEGLNKDTSPDSEDEDAPVDPEAAALEAAREGTLFGNVIGTSLVEALSFMNHSCLPNARIDFATSVTPNVSAPGLWVYSAARRPLIPGDEVQMCYVPSVVGKPLEERQKRMKKFGFECKCRCCTTDSMLEAEIKQDMSARPR